MSGDEVESLREELASEKWRHDTALERDYFRARLAAVEALCDVWATGTFDGDPAVPIGLVRAAARGETP